MNNDIELTKPLIFPSSFQDETPIGYLIRLAELNDYGSFKWIVGEHHTDVSSVIHNVYYKILCKYEWTGFGEHSEYTNYQDLSQSYFVARSHRFCPLCLGNRPYFKMCWQLRASVVCLEHNCWLHDYCFKCESQNSFFTSKIKSCKCGESYMNLEITRAPDEVIRLQKFLLGLPLQNNLEEIWTNEENKKMAFSERLDLVTFFTKWFGFRTKSVNLRDMDLARIHISNAAEALFSGKSGINNFLKKINESRYENAKKPGEFFTKFRCEFYEEFKQDSLEPIRVLIEEYINRSWYKPINRRNTNLHSRTISEHPWIPFQLACKEYDIHKSVLKNAIENHLIRYDKDIKQKRTLTYIFKPDLEDRLHRIKDFITAREAAVILGLTKVQFSILKNKNLFEVAIPPTKGVSAVWKFSRDEICSYKDKVLEGLSKLNDDTWTFTQILQFHSRSIDDPLVTILGAIEKREIKPLGRSNSKAGFSSMIFSRVEFLAWLETYRSRSSGDKMTVSVAAKLLGINQEFAYQLINHGYLDFVLTNGSSTKWITQNNIDVFSDRYILLSRLAKKSSLSSRVIKSYLETREVYSLDYEEKFQLRQKLYEKKDLKNIQIFHGLI